MEDVRMLAPDSDFSRFVARSVDPDVRRSALRTLFSDPHFQQMDGLDIYIDDYTRPSPLPPEMVAALWHARSTLNPQPLYPVREERTTETVTPAEADGDTAALAADRRPQECEPDATAEPDAGDAAEDSSAEGTPLPFNEHVNFSHGSDADCNTPKSE
ncbi:hypothetical protein NCCP691_02660 [Noviherbaspirillum aridicola]|uniref:Uncharacterized protein n=2 Tax=Noviherbaspirillum aridicola TaxID=2849687 RepID=A0ABQ4PZM9_9BURK|nr:hypothetical protein NCCP691_02660 [Noviherbaspirillum aridicola]